MCGILRLYPLCGRERSNHMPQHKTTKRAASGMGSIRKTQRIVNGKIYTYYEARYTVGFHPGTGKQIQKSITGKTQKEVSQKLKAIESSLDTGNYIEPCKMSVSEWLDSWVSGYLRNLKPLTEKTYSDQVTLHLKPGLGAVKLKDLDAHTIQTFYNSLSANGLAPKTVKNIHGVLHSALQQAVSNGYIQRNPADACKLPKVTRPEIKPLEPHELKQLLCQAGHDAYSNLFIVAMFTGMRQGELLGLAWDAVDFKNGTITIRQQLQCKDGSYFLESPKNGKIRTVLPAQIVMDALEKEKAQQLRAKESAGSTWTNPYNLVFTDQIGKHLVRRTVVKHFKKLMSQANLSSSTRFHDLRHSFAVTSLSSGDDIKTVQANLGHASAQFTLDVYGHVTKKMQKDSAERIQLFYEQLQMLDTPENTQ